MGWHGGGQENGSQTIAEQVKR